MGAHQAEAYAVALCAEFLGMKSLLRYFRRMVGRMLPNSVRCRLIQVWDGINVMKARLRLTIGVEPLSYVWGSDRGLSIYRYYLERFLQQFSGDIRGQCLEFQNPGYTPRFGGPAVEKLDILHVDDSNPLATIVADLTKPNNIPSDRFDCIICTHVLHIIFELDKAVSELYRILRPGGVLLVAVPQVSMCDPRFHEIWRFTPEGLAVVLSKAFGEKNVLVRAYGNSLTAAGEIRGLVASEFSTSTLDYHDPRFAVEVCARACKSQYGEPHTGDGLPR
jgi:SAM-dependent methyltransferase